MFTKLYAYSLTVLQLAVDYLAIEVSFFLGYIIWIGSNPKGHFQPIEMYIMPFLFSGIIFVAIFSFLGLYHRRVSILNIEEPKKIIEGLAIGFLLILSISYFYRVAPFSRLVIVYSVILMFFFIGIERTLLKDFHEWFHKHGLSSHPVLIYGAGKVGQMLIKRLDQHPSLGYVPIGFIDDNLTPGTTINGHQVLGNFDDLVDLKDKHKFHQLFIAMPSISSDRITKIVDRCRSLGISFKIVPNLYEIALEKSRLDIIDGIPLVDVRDFKPKTLTNIGKGIIDTISSFIFLIILSPVFLIIAILIRRDSKGPVLFRQDRVGRDGQIFKLYKFRTMHHDVHPYEPCPKDSQDRRITKFGFWLRKTSLDELPQLINVLKGEMSLVGPRPEMPFIVEKYYDDLHRERLKVRPGITGLWQISGDRRLEIHENIEYDLFYIENQSLLLDLVIFIRTIWCVVNGLGV